MLRNVLLTTAIAVIVSLSLAPAAMAGKKIPVVWVTDNTPGGDYIVGGGTSFQKDKPGIEIELYQLVAKKLNIDLQLKRLPWKLCLQQIEHNQVDGVFPASFKEKRLKIGVYPFKDGKPDTSKKSRNNGYFLYTLKGSPLSWDGEAFSNATDAIAIPAGWAVADDLKKMNLTLKEVPVHANSPDLLVQRRVQGFICLESVFDSYIKRQPEKYKDVVKSEAPIWEKPYYLMLSHKFVKKHPKLAQDIWNAIRDLKMTDEFAAIVSKYMN